MTIRNRLKRLEARMGADAGLRPLVRMTDAELERTSGIPNPSDADRDELIRRSSDQRVSECVVARLEGHLPHNAYLPEMTSAEKTGVEALWMYSPALKKVMDCNPSE